MSARESLGSVELGTWRLELSLVGGALWLSVWSDGWPDGSRRLVPDTPLDESSPMQIAKLRALIAKAERFGRAVL